MKKLYALILAFAMLLCCACAATPRETSSTEPSTEQTEPTEAFPVTTEPLEELLTESYTLEQLQEYFGPYSTSAENDWAGIDTDKSRYGYYAVAAAFPGGCLRSMEHEDPDWTNYYSVFKVTEGGYYYVFWNAIAAGLDYTGTGELEDRVAGDMLYVTSLKSIEDFAAIEPGVSTATDVAKLDTASEFCFGMGRGIASWHLLNDGSVVEIMYSATDSWYETHSRSDLIVKSIEIFKTETTRSLLVKIDPNDLP